MFYMTVISNVMPFDELHVPNLYFSLARATVKREERKEETPVILTLAVLLTAQEHAYFCYSFWCSL